MSNYLKGNYRLRRKKDEASPSTGRKKLKETPRDEFERRALERLGGSIAYVSLNDTFVWRGEDDDKAR